MSTPQTKNQSLSPKHEGILRVWRETEELDPDISTERLIAITMDIAQVSHDDVLDAIESEILSAAVVAEVNKGVDNHG